MRIPAGAHLERHSLPAILLPAEEPGPPSTAFPGASPAAAPVPQTYPAPGPTFDSFLYSQIATSATTGTANNFTLAQSITITDTGGGVDSDALRPAMLTLEHDTTLAAVAGVGTSLECWTKDAAGTRVRIGRDIVEITTTTAGSVDSTRAFCLQKGNEEIEIMRLRGAVGQAKYTPVGGTTGLSGKAGGQLLVWGSLYHFGNEIGFLGTAPVTKQTVAVAATDLASVITLANSLRSALIAYGLA